jgi:hypothetical protein
MLSVRGFSIKKRKRLLHAGDASIDSVVLSGGYTASSTV